MSEPTISYFQKAFQCLERNRCIKAPSEIRTTEQLAREIAEESGVEWSPDETGTQQVGNTIIHVLY